MNELWLLLASGPLAVVIQYVKKWIEGKGFAGPWLGWFVGVVLSVPVIFGLAKVFDVPMGWKEIITLAMSTFAASAGLHAGYKTYKNGKAVSE